MEYLNTLAQKHTAHSELLNQSRAYFTNKYLCSNS